MSKPLTVLQRTPCLTAACFMAGLAWSALAHATLELTNSTDVDQTYDVSVSWNDPPPPDTLVETITLKKGESAVYGGKKGRRSSKDKTLREKDNKVFRNGIQISSLVPVFDPTSPGALQVAALLAAADGLSGVHAFFDFGTAGYQQLVADVDFSFIGFDPGRTPILVEVGTGTRITDATGHLLAQYRYDGRTIEVGTLAVANDVAEPPVLPLVLVAGLGWLCGGRRSRHSHVVNPPPPAPSPACP